MCLNHKRVLLSLQIIRRKVHSPSHRVAIRGFEGYVPHMTEAERLELRVEIPPR